MTVELDALWPSGVLEVVDEGAYDGEGLTEGPVWHPSGRLTFVRHRLNLLFEWTPGGATQVIRRDTQHGNGCTLDGDGRLVMCEGTARRLVRIEPDGAATTITDTWQGKRYHKPNDVVRRSDGLLFFTDPSARVAEDAREIAFSGVFRVSEDGGESAVATDQCEYPNGLAFAPGESLLYVAITRRDALCMEEGVKGAECRHRLIRVFDVAADGALTNNRVFADLYTPRSGGPDGLKVDADGRVYCASAGGVWVFAADGQLVGLIETPAKARNLAFGGADGTTLFICAGESVYSAQLTVGGASG